MKFTELNENNYVIFAIRNYENPHAVTKEDFEEDLKRFKWVKRLLKRYRTTGVLKAHLLINHFIILYNVFGEASTHCCFIKLITICGYMVKTFIVYLGKFPEYPKSHLHDIPLDDTCLDCLKQL